MKRMQEKITTQRYTMNPLKMCQGSCISELHVEFKSKSHLGNACTHLGQNLLLSHLLSKFMKTKTNRNIILPVVLHVCVTQYFTLRKEYSLRVLRIGRLFTCGAC
jgi:hypothetical protein